MPCTCIASGKVEEACKESSHGSSFKTRIRASRLYTLARRFGNVAEVSAEWLERITKGTGCLRVVKGDNVCYCCEYSVCS